MKGRVAKCLRWLLEPFAPRCLVIVIFGDGSFLAAKFSRLEPVRPRIEVESVDARGSRATACELVVNLGSVRIYRLVERRSRAVLVN